VNSLRQSVLCALLILGIALGNCLQCFMDLQPAKAVADPHACCHRTQKSTPAPDSSDHSKHPAKQGCPLVDGDLSRAVASDHLKLVAPAILYVDAALPIPELTFSTVSLSAVISADPGISFLTPLRI